MKNNQKSFYCFGRKPLSFKNDIYEIGSITKPFTTSLLTKYISKKHIKLEDTIDLYLQLPTSNYPTILQLDKNCDIISHHGGTGCFTSYLVFSKSKQVALTILSNYPYPSRTKLSLQLINKLLQ